MEKEFIVGQVWSYQTREGEEESTILLFKIEKESVGTIIHIQVRGVLFSGGIIPHMPFAKNAIEKSVIKLKGIEEFSQENEGYGIWREAFDHGQAGIFSIPISEAVNIIQKAISE